MGFKVNFDSLDAMYSGIYAQAANWLTALETLNGATTTLAETTEMSGAGADSIRSYMSAVHGTIQGLLAQLIQLHEKNNFLYKTDYQQNIDTALHAVIQENELDAIRSSLSRQRNQAIDVDGELHDAMNRIRDIFSPYYNDISNVDDSHNDAMNFLSGLDESVKELESRHTANDFINTGDMITNLTAMIQELSSHGRSYKSDFSMEQLAGSETFQNLYASYLNVTKELDDKASAIDAAIDHENLRAAALQEEYEERQKKAQAAKWIVTGLCVIGSIVAIAATGGAATPLVVGAISAASSAVIAGTSNLADQYVEKGNLNNVDWGSFGKDVAVGAVTGFVTGYVGASVGGAITSGLSKTATGASLLNSSNTIVRIGTGAAIGSVSEVGSGIVSRGATTLITSGGDLEESMDAAFNLENIAYDAAMGGISGGMSNMHDPNASVKTPVDEVKDEYFSDLKSMSEYPDTIDDSLKTGDWHKIDPETNGQMRTEFNSKRADMISEWEELNGTSWPKYQEDVYSSNGKLIRKAGDNYDAHHIQPLTYGGQNTAQNLTPLHANVHFDKQGVHAPNSSYARIEEILKEAAANAGK